MVRFKTIRQFSNESGYTENAIRTKIRDGIWEEGVWVKAPDNRVLIDIEAYNSWAVNIPESHRAQAHQLRSPSHTKGGVAGKRYNSPPPLLT